MYISLAVCLYVCVYICIYIYIYIYINAQVPKNSEEGFVVWVTVMIHALNILNPNFTPWVLAEGAELLEDVGQALLHLVLRLLGA